MPISSAYRPVSTPGGTTSVRLAVDSWNGAGVDAYGTSWEIVGVDGYYGSPAIRLGGIDRPQDHGEFDGPSFYSPRIITVQGVAIAADQGGAMVAADIVSSVCSDPSRLYTALFTEVPRGVTRQLGVRLNADTKVALAGPQHIEWQVQLRAPDPFKYDTALTQVTLYAPGGSIGGTPFPATFPLLFNASGLAASGASVVNAGTANTRPTVTFTGPLVDPAIANVTSGRSLSLLMTLVAGDQLVVDFDQRSVILNGSASRSTALSSTAAWWDLPPGGSDLMFTAGGGGGTATVAFRSAWR